MRTDMDSLPHVNGSAPAIESARARQRVLIYGINYAPELTGVGRYTGEIGAYLAARDIDVEVVTAVPHYPGWAIRDGYRNHYSVETLDGARVNRCPLLLRTNMRGLWRVLAPLSFALTSAPVVLWRILTRRPNTVLCIEPTLFSAPLALFAAKLVGSKTVLHVQDLEIDAAFAVGHIHAGVLKRLAFWLERGLLRRFGSVVTISTGMKDMLRAKGISQERLSIVRNWIDIKKFERSREEIDLCGELGLPPNTFIGLYAGNIGPKQALPLLLDAAESLSDRSNVFFIIAGEGPEKIHLISRYGHLPNVRFLPVQEEERFMALLRSVDFHVLPQQPGTSNLVLPSKLGAMLASGKPCIVMADQNSELHVFVAGAAVVIKPGDSKALANAIMRLANSEVSPDRSKQISLAETLDARRSLAAFSRLLVGV